MQMVFHILGQNQLPKLLARQPQLALTTIPQLIPLPQQWQQVPLEVATKNVGYKNQARLHHLR
jgi:hypothetical protein